MIPRTLSAPQDANDRAEPHGPALAAYARRHLALVASEDLCTARRLVAEKIIHLSFDAGRFVARLPDQLRLCIVTGLHKNDVSWAVTVLVDARLLERWHERGETLYRFLPHTPGWRVRWRHSDARARQLAIDTEAWLFSLNVAAPQEQELPLPPELPSFDDALAEVSRESALADEQRGRPLVTEVSLAAGPSHPSERAPGRRSARQQSKAVSAAEHQPQQQHNRAEARGGCARDGRACHGTNIRRRRIACCTHHIRRAEVARRTHIRHVRAGGRHSGQANS